MSSPKFDFSNKLTAGFRALTYPAPCGDIHRYPIYGDFGSPAFNRYVVPVIASLAPRGLFRDAKDLLRILGAFEQSLIRKLDFDQEIVLGSGRDPVAFYRALQNPEATIVEINLPDFHEVKKGLVEQKLRTHSLDLPNLRHHGMDLLREELSGAPFAEELDERKTLLVYEVGLTMYLNPSDQERLFANIDRLFRQMKNTCIFLASNFDRALHGDHRRDVSLNGLVLLIEKVFGSKIHIANHSPDDFFRDRGYRVVRGGQRLYRDILLDQLRNGLAVSGYVLHD